MWNGRDDKREDIGKISAEYVKWSQKYKRRFKSKRDIGKRFTKEFGNTKVVKGKRYYCGIELITEEEIQRSETVQNEIQRMEQIENAQSQMERIQTFMIS